MKLVYQSTGLEVKVGDRVDVSRENDLHSEFVYITAIQRPRTPASTGRVYAQREGGPDYSAGFFPSVIGAKWIEREDQDD